MAGSLLPYHCAFASKEARGGTPLQAFLFAETLAALRAAFPRLPRGYVKRWVCQASAQCLILLSSGG